MDSVFNQTRLFEKAKLYAQRAVAEDRTGEVTLFPFWLSLALEFLARSTLSFISPLLLAENKQGDGAHLLTALGYQSKEKPRSIPISTVLSILMKIEKDFTEKDKEICGAIMEERNSELHSGAIGYEKYPARLWLGDYYRICETLLKIQKRSLEDLFGSEEAQAAEIMIRDIESSVKSKIKKEIATCKNNFLKLDKAERERKKQEAETALKQKPLGTHEVPCPACGTKGFVTGKLISTSDPKLDGEDIKQEYRYLPQAFTCQACQLKIDSYTELKVADMGAQYSIINYLDPTEYHNIDIEERVDARLEEISREFEYQDE